ncbi:hypothetical protein F8G81_04030 [Arthrobacter sp. CDRTa11]|uniref:hypothetical protein n=1 Tax=Arthrobacter sp. CDRTa11 TaxID=2651199 RepID=UPI002265E6C5|nr:hypothetical protein [Arthrobacter sp. CDRTa11]UZX01889.1 hypothetical protein F8G81_04030 [Arthrobacter sp. CDRTa11]
MRTHRARAPFHVFRAAALSTGILTLAAGAHVAAGGQLPGFGILLAVFALTGLAATSATRLRLNLPAMIAVLGTGQVILHEVFTAFSGPAPADGGTVAGAHGSHSPGLAPPVLEGMTGHPHQLDSAAGLAMLLAHAVATAGCALLLAKGESALWALAAWLGPLIQLAQAVMPDAGPPPAVTRPGTVPSSPRWRNLRQDSRRGPPFAVALS